ncbi:TlpA family protein disulfide reductase [Actinoplanes flavus]|uniref:TlpA family protein disulfide reductase n=1 Tax=Actinoplanes flavus TaxID=2820290 RepID=A0ABS3USE6_9ACTN|nr:TlpA disulfide reductase family protein [Actinoplanes flavus]MBO3741491.1 TlpA family protein disulfide reductase [Actinoplanes flavus]
MGYLYALVAVLSAISVLNLLLTLGIIRRLRSRPMNQPVDYPGVLPAGTVLEDFAARDLRGRPVSRDELSGRTLVGFFSPGCSSCLDRLPDFVAVSAAFGRERSWAVLLGDVASAGEYLPSLEPVARVVPQDPDGPLISAFSVSAFPTFFVVDATGRILASGLTTDDLSVPTAV